jgi:hypothetical protein
VRFGCSFLPRTDFIVLNLVDTCETFAPPPTLHPVDRWKETLHAGQSASSKDFPVLTKKIDEGATACAAKLAQGLKILGAVKKNRAAFPHIDDRELRSRDDFLREMDVMCKDIKAQLTSPESKKRIADDKKKVRVLQSVHSACWRIRVSSLLCVVSLSTSRQLATFAQCTFLSFYCISSLSWRRSKRRKSRPNTPVSSARRSARIRSSSRSSAIRFAAELQSHAHSLSLVVHVSLMIECMQPCIWVWHW